MMLLATDYKLFTPRRGGKNLGIIIAGMSFFPIFGIVAIVMGSVPEGLAIIGFGLLIFAYMIQRYLGLGRKYGINEEGVWLKTGRKSLLLVNADIKSVTVLDQEALDAFIGEYSREILSSQGDYNISRWYRSSKRYNELVRYVSVVITEEETREGGPTNITKYTIHIDGPAVLIKSKNGESYLTTPENPSLFAENIRIPGV